MTNEEKIAALEKEVADLKAMVADIFDALKLESSSTTEMFTEIIDYLMPVVHKVFPKIAEGQSEIAAFLKRRRSSSGGKSSI